MKDTVQDIKNDMKLEADRMAEYKKYGPPCEVCTLGNHDPRIDDLCQIQCIDCGALFTRKGLKIELIEQLGEDYQEEYDRLIKIKNKVSKRRFEPGYRDPDLTLFDYEAHNGETRSRYFYEN